MLITKNPIEQTIRGPTTKPTYGFASTQSIINTFEAKGWNVVSTQVLKTNKEERQGFQKHLIRLEHPNFSEIPGLTEANKSRAQLCLLNSHDGSTSLRMFYGLLRIACLNGIIAGTALRDVKIIHNANIIKHLQAGIDAMANGMPGLIAQIRALQGAQFTDAAYSAYIKELMDLRFANIKGLQRVNSAIFYKPRRAQDISQDAFTRFNVAQEVLIRGGIQYTYLKDIKNAAGEIIGQKLQSSTTQRLSSINSQVALNRAAYDLALKYAA